jgi:hypothetical protein
MPRPELAELEIGDPPEQWAALGFEVSPTGAIELGGVKLQLGLPGDGITAWTLRGIAATDSIDGLPTRVIDESVDRAELACHPNGAIALDHVVILTPDFERTAAALSEHGMPLRRESERNGARQGFRRLGPAIMEIVQAPDGHTRFWGLVAIVSDLDALGERLGDDLSAPRSAVQPGRRIATLRRSAGLGLALAFMDPEPE